MEKMQIDDANKKPDVIDQFNEIFFNHLERLIGSRFGIGELILNPLTISIITLLMERENGIEGFVPDENDRYTHETLIEDVEDMGLRDDQDMNVVIENMIQKNYIRAEGDRLIPQKPTVSMARLMDLVFPKMPGMNLIAYFVQTLDEVKSGRKDIDSAADQFDQILQMQGIPLEKDPRAHTPPKISRQLPDKSVPTRRFKNATQNNKKISLNTELKTTSILGRKSRDILLDHAKGSSNEPKVLSSDAYNGKTKITKLNFGESGLKEIKPDKTSSDRHEHIEIEKPQTSDQSIETSPHNADESQKLDTDLTISLEEPIKTDSDDPIDRFDASTSNLPGYDSISFAEDTSQDLKSIEQDKSKFYDDPIAFPNTVLHQEKSESVKEIIEDNPETPFQKEDSIINSATLPTENDDDIEKRITAFEEDLALECPICRRSKLKVKNTATGKPYYKCSNKECSFISWGKPHHIQCPKCNNPFLIETSNKAGISSLKCPRATCRYWEKIRPDKSENRKEQTDSATQNTNTTASLPQKPRRRVVRRRVVRRKR